MARDASGNYSLPASGSGWTNPVVSGTTISPSWANTTLTDIATELQDSLSRSGKGGLLAAFKLIDGGVGTPALSFTNEPSSGLYRNGSGDVRLSVLGSDTVLAGSAGVTLRSLALAGSTGLTFNTANAFSGTNKLISIQNAGVEKAYFQADGALYINTYLTLTVGNFSSYVPNLYGSGATGNWGINVTGTAAVATTATITDETASASTHYVGIHAASTGNAACKTSSTKLTFVPSTGALTCAGDVTAFSDARVKKNVERIRNALDKVLTLKGVTFTRTDLDGNPRGTGLIAQDVQRILPEAVTTTAGGTLALAYGNVVGLLVEAIKELEGRIHELEMAR